MTDTHHSNKQTKGALTKQKIIVEARNLFYKQGFDATSTSQIAKTVGVSEAALYKHFKGKMALLLATVEPARSYDKEESYYAILSNIDLISAWTDQIIATVFHNRPQYSIIFSESPRHPELSENYIRHIHQLTNADKELLKRMDEGKLPKLDLILFQVGLIGSFLAMLTHKSIYEPNLNLQEIPEDIHHILLSIVEGKLFQQ
ncbi:TetR/AcrR family transcriptional regulator [Viridibacillus sp. FSL R5-0477]|uniref:TetR family transcriptional regulator n=1 Tax=Viridibacillus arenosi FSL R5-213 TaxID=1227360 RepID=W4ERG9_9BACL|nr:MULTISPECIES: TetR/AcrR family transcriptional regulator [Viridibacillus]ETT82869.1 TetR family transcriptional regulator [Viridibacillus arenosi FSL R5-213]OMC82181.1 TetR family transcriptional regulator [Viridibacillus sp. FSL H8-0123]OMC86338.1 TetR family transcriptional regulator [Viridibacillus sp. FSL H7-0596]OMC90758.1 TetR family transcriptional regulator [Viridibacillus arenosi]